MYVYVCIVYYIIDNIGEFYYLRGGRGGINDLDIFF